MPFETGGRADKFGNRYEGRWVIKQLLRLVKEEISSITLEAIGNEEEGIDLWIRGQDESQICCQCKARNGSKEYWTIGDLGTRGILRHAKKQLDSSEEVTYQLVSAVNCKMLNDINERARNSNDNATDFYEFQIKSSFEVDKAYKKIVEYFDLDYNVEQDNERAFCYLKRMYVIHFPDDLETKKTLIETIKHLFIGNPETVYNLLLNYPIENNYLGKEISSYMIMNFLEDQPGVSLRQLHKDDRIIPRMEFLNREFDSAFVRINDSLIHREQTEECYRESLNGNSMIIHGKAGSGKSGSVVELLNKLKQDNIVHLALKLDRRVPEYSSEHYGSQLDLPASPVFCIDAVSKDKEAVLILDQLDAIRWTNNHSSTALEVCKEMITEVNNINLDRDRKVSLVFVCRTFDLQNDNGIRQLFSKVDSKVEEVSWEKIKIRDLDDGTVKMVMGRQHNHLSKKLKTLMKIPSNLYIWSNLEDSKRKNVYKSSSDLIQQWWEQLSTECEVLGISIHDLNELKDTIVKQIDKLGKLMIPVQLASHCSNVAKEQLLSNGLLFSDGKRIGFVHQSFYDYFLVEKMIQQIFHGDAIVEILGDTSKQTPSRRYQLQMLLENLLDYDIDELLKVGNDLLQSENIRFYMKYVFLEVLGQAESISRKTEVFLKEFIDSENWRSHLLDAVFVNHPTFIKFLIREGYITAWLKSERDRELAMTLLRSVNFELTNEVTSVLYPLAFKEPGLDNKIYNVLCEDIADDSDEMFDFRMEILKFRPQLWNAHFYWERLADNAQNKALYLIDVMVKNVTKESIGKRLDLNDKAIKALAKIAKDNPYQVWKNFMSYIATSTQNIISIYDKKLDFWISKQHMDQNYGRTYIEMAKVAGKELVEIDSKEFFANCSEYYDCSSLVINEILLDIMENLPLHYSDDAILWLIEKPQMRFFNYTGGSAEYLFTTKQIIEKHSKTCSDAVFKNLENVLYYFHEEDELLMAQYRFGFNKENRENHNKTVSYLAYWGEVQNYLLPALDSNRMSRNTYELKRTLMRRFKNKDIRHKRNKVRSGFVGSTIGAKTEKISDNQWLRIMGKKDYKRENWSLGPFLESSPWQFSRDFERAGKKEPNRFANLALTLPNDVDNHYVSAIFNVIGEKEPSQDMVEDIDGHPVSLNTAQRLYKKWGDRDDLNVAMCFCRGIKNRAEEMWDTDILNKISHIAKNHSNPEQGEQNITSYNDKEGKTVHSLFQNSINCVRGCAGGTIAALLWKDRNRYEHLKDAIESVVKDENLAVNMSAIECIIPIMNFDKEYATKCFFELAHKDLRIVAHPFAYNFFYYLYNNHRSSIKGLVIDMFNCEFEDVAKVGANHLANMNVLYGCFRDAIFKDDINSKNQLKGIIDVAVDLIGYQEHHEKCKELIVHFLDEEADLNISLSQLLYKERLNIQKDAEFILKLITSKGTRKMVHDLVDYINDHDVPIKIFKDVIFSMLQNIIQNSKQEDLDPSNELYGIAPELSKLIALLYDRTQDDFEVNQQCLDMWDKMFENRVGTIRELTRAIMDT